LDLSAAIAMFSMVATPVLSLVSASSALPVMPSLYGDNTTAAAQGQQERNDDQLNAVLHGIILSSAFSRRHCLIEDRVIWGAHRSAAQHASGRRLTISSHPGALSLRTCRPALSESPAQGYVKSLIP